MNSNVDDLIAICKKYENSEEIWFNVPGIGHLTHRSRIQRAARDIREEIESMCFGRDIKVQTRNGGNWEGFGKRGYDSMERGYVAAQVMSRMYFSKIKINKSSDEFAEDYAILVRFILNEYCAMQHSEEVIS
jgi:hypothetical protein